MADQAEYELIPLTPIRRMEKEIADLKKNKEGGSTAFLVNEIVDILKMNQKIVDDMVRLHGDLVSKLSRTTDRIDRLVTSMDKLVEILGEATEAELAGESGGYRGGGGGGGGGGVADEKMDKVIEQNAALINSLKVISGELGKLGEVEKGLQKLENLEKESQRAGRRGR
ncbi:MAG: hypothetical protein QF415_10905 [Candidatus Undinarchaeales archaeon]|jgi:hypothetical protein|nr:hypothetical protein [Candidatus Undinarchaeales archaeon]MDP7494321.1 hypothetical protein [Candidatus Undinarchaeales archaeon]